MDIPARWAVIGILAMAALAWLLMREPEGDPFAKRPDREALDAAERAADGMPVLYRWRDDAGVLQVTEQPPKGRKYETVVRDAPPAIEVRGERR